MDIISKYLNSDWPKLKHNNQLELSMSMLIQLKVLIYSHFYFLVLVLGWHAPNGLYPCIVSYASNIVGCLTNPENPDQISGSELCEHEVFLLRHPV